MVEVGFVVAWNEGGDFGGRSCQAAGDVMAEEGVDGVWGVDCSAEWVGIRGIYETEKGPGSHGGP